MNNEIGNNIKKYRLQQNISREVLAEKLKISIHTLAKYEQGQRHPSIDTLKEIAEILDVPLINIIGVRKAMGFVPRTKDEMKIMKDVTKNIPTDEFLYSPSELIRKHKEDILNSIVEIAKLSDITINETEREQKLLGFELDDEGNNMPVYDFPYFNGINVEYKNKNFSLTKDDYYKLAGRIIEFVAINILASKDYQK